MEYTYFITIYQVVCVFVPDAKLYSKAGKEAQKSAHLSYAFRRETREKKYPSSPSIKYNYVEENEKYEVIF